MAIAFDSAQTSTANGVSSRTWSHTCTGSDRFLVVYCQANSAGNTATVTGVTYNGVAMTLGPNTLETGNFDCRVYAYYLANPASGANNVVVSFSTASNNTVCASVSYTGVNQSVPLGGTGTNGANSTNANVSVTIANSNSWLAACAWLNGVNPTVAGGGTQRAEVQGANGHYINAQDKSVSTGSQSASWTNNSNFWLAVGFELKEAVAANTGGFFLATSR